MACFPPVRRRCYEVFLRTHQCLALCIWLSIWLHVRNSGSLVAKYGVVAAGACFILGTAEVALRILILNKWFLCGMPRARISLVGRVVRVVIVTPTRFGIHAGQHIYVWMPGVSLSSCLQLHPFVVVSARHVGQGLKMELMIEPRHGWTSTLAQRAREEETGSTAQSYRVLFSHPHGPRIPVDDYGRVILAASGWGLMAQIPFLLHLIRGYQSGTTRARRIHLIWQLGHEGALRFSSPILFPLRISACSYDDLLHCPLLDLCLVFA